LKRHPSPRILRVSTSSIDQPLLQRIPTWTLPHAQDASGIPGTHLDCSLWLCLGSEFYEHHCHDGPCHDGHQNCVRSLRLSFNLAFNGIFSSDSPHFISNCYCNPCPGFDPDCILHEDWSCLRSTRWAVDTDWWVPVTRRMLNLSEPCPGLPSAFWGHKNRWSARIDVASSE
jgi:hypothetical protein